VADQYEVPGDITLDEKIEYLTNSLKPQLHDRWHFTKSIEVLKALETTYDPEADKTLKETNDAALADSKRRVLRCQILIAKFQEDLKPILAEQKQRDEAAKELAEKQKQLREKIQSAGDRRDWDELDRLEAESNGKEPVQAGDLS
jgi:uncharacterized protein with von Willebrand factor type A (vWA) domain